MIRIKFAETAVELDGLFQARYRVFVEHGGYFPPNQERRIYDRYDAFPTTRNVIALDGARVIAGLRFTEMSPVGTPADGSYDWSPHAPPDGGRWGGTSSMVLEPEYRGTKVARRITETGFAWMIREGWRLTVAAANPERLAGFQRLGWRALGPEQYDAHKGVPFVPIAVTVADLDAATARIAHAIASAPVVEIGDVRIEWPGAAGTGRWEVVGQMLSLAR